MKTSTCRDGTLKNQPNKIGTTPQYFLYTIPTSCAILPTMPCVGYLWAQKGCLWGARLWSEQHKHLQSCVGTRARLGYAAFDAQLRKAYFVTTRYAIRMSVHVQSCSHPQHNSQQHALHTHHWSLHAGPGIPGLIILNHVYSYHEDWTQRHVVTSI